MENLATFNVTPSVYEHALTPTWERADSYHGMMTEVPYFDATVRKVKGKVISVRTSDKTYDSFSSSVGNGHLMAVGTGSFIQMHNDISNSVIADVTSLALSQGSSRAGRPSTPPTGEYVPVGNAVLPMLLIACVYMFVRMFRNRKLNKTVSSQNL